MDKKTIKKLNEIKNRYDAKRCDYGVKGMKWGHHNPPNDPPSSGGAVAKPKKKEGTTYTASMSTIGEESSRRPNETFKTMTKSPSVKSSRKKMKLSAIKKSDAEDITNLSFEDAANLRAKKHLECIATSKGTYGMNGALLQDEDGKQYKITARNSTLLQLV